MTWWYLSMFNVGGLIFDIALREGICASGGDRCYLVLSMVVEMGGKGWDMNFEQQCHLSLGSLPQFRVPAHHCEKTSLKVLQQNSALNGFYDRQCLNWIWSDYSPQMPRSEVIQLWRTLAHVCEVSSSQLRDTAVARWQRKVHELPIPTQRVSSYRRNLETKYSS